MFTRVEYEDTLETDDRNENKNHYRISDVLFFLINNVFKHKITMHVHGFRRTIVVSVPDAFSVVTTFFVGSKSLRINGAISD